MVFTPIDNQAQYTDMSQNIQQSASPSGNGGGDMDASVAPTQVRDAFSRNADGHSKPVNDSPDNLNSTTRDVESENDSQFAEEHDTTNNPNSVLFVIHSRTKKLEGGFQPISPPDEGEPHVFTQHNVRDEDWAQFLTDLQDAARLHDSPPTRKSLSLPLTYHHFLTFLHVAPPSSLPGLFSSLNLGEGNMPVVHSALASSSPIQPAMVIKLWNKHYFHARGLDIVLAKGPRSLSGDTAMPPPDFSEPSSAFDRDAFVPSFHTYGLPHPPMMHPPPLPFMGHMHTMHGPPPFPGMHHGAFPGAPFPPMHDHDQQLPGFDFMNPRGGFRGRGGRGGRGGSGDRGRGFGHFFGGRGGFAGGMFRMDTDFGMSGRDGFGSRGRGNGPRGRGGFVHFGQHPHTGFSVDDFEFATFGDDGDMNDIVDLCDVGEDVTEPADDRKRSHSVCSDSSSSTMSSSDGRIEKAEKQEKGKERADKPGHEHRRGSHHRHGHGHSYHRRGDRFARHDLDAHRCGGHRRGHVDAKMAQKFACRRGHFGLGMRGGGFGHSFMPHRHFPGMFSDDGYYRLIVVDRQV